jgi:hypothetical protein
MKCADKISLAFQMRFFVVNLLNWMNKHTGIRRTNIKISYLTEG